MKLEASQFRFLGESFHGVAVAIVCLALFAPGYPRAWAQQGESQVMTTAEEAPKIPNDQLDSLVAPIALYPDQLLAQILAACRAAVGSIIDLGVTGRTFQGSFSPNF